MREGTLSFVDLAPETALWLEKASLDKRKRLGQYMTPKPVRDRLLSRLQLRPGDRVLDPGVGTGEFLRSAIDTEPEITAFGWDVDPDVLDAAKQIVPEARLDLRSALEQSDERFDFVIGNPPYLQTSDRELRERFSAVVSGRANMFAFFIKAGLDLLSDGGYLAFVVPPSMNNGRYFLSLREFIADHAEIESLEVLPHDNLFVQAITAAQILILKKGGRSERHQVREGDHLVFAEDVEPLKRMFSEGTSLWDLGYQAKTGTIIWNQHKETLLDRPRKGTVRLVWASDIAEGRLRKSSRPGWVKGVEPEKGRSVLVNRIVGKVGSGKLRATLSPDGLYVAENHVNVITVRPDMEPHVTMDALVDMLLHETTADRVRLLTGNSQISATELTHLLHVGQTEVS